MITLARDFNFELTNNDANEYYGLGRNRKRFRKLTNKHPETRPFAVEYMAGRGISEEVTKKRFSPADFILSYLKHGFVPEKNIVVSERKKSHGTVTAGNR